VELDDIVREFLLESHENLDQLDQDLVQLEHDPSSRPLLGSIFRTIHTVKGTCGFLPFPHLERVTHVGESLLAQLRDGRLALTPDMVSALLQLVDAIRGALARIETTGEEGAVDHAALIAALTALQDPDAQPAPTADQPPYASPVLVGPVVGAQRLGQVLVQQGAVEQDDVTLAVLAQSGGDDRRIGDILVGLGATTADDVTDALETQAEVGRSAADRSIRVDVELLDSLMRLVGELVLTRNQIVQHVAAPTAAGLARSSQRLNLIANELQEGVMKTRLQPIDNVWSKLARVVRDVGVVCGKQVRLELQGRDTELDKTLLEAIKDPLTHCVRNALDHGIETPEERQAAGKPAEGTLLLRAFHEGGQVFVEVIDDGRGIDPARLAEKALEHGLVNREQLDRMSERELLHLVFLPGLSTAGEVTTVSGRGVGMDVVKTNVEKVGGTVDVVTAPGRGTTFRFKIPLTLAIIPALTVTCGAERYAIPQVSLVELVRLDEAQAQAGKGIEHISGFPVLRLRGTLLPLVFLDEQLGLAPPDDSGGTTFIVVLQADERQFGLVVHQVLDTEEIVVKPLGAQLKGLAMYAGATILGDGTVALILDSIALARQAHVLHRGSDRPVLEDAGAALVADQATEPLLVVACAGRRGAIPLGMVTRLEQFPPSAVEQVGSREVVQYRGKILPLVHVGRWVGGTAETGRDSLPVVVCSRHGRSVGLVVDAILDITHESVSGRSDLEDSGLLGTAVVQGRVTELLDVRQAVVQGDPHFYDAVDVREQAGAVA
jgi:two-component system chemotaxis sensor kinase CheA